MTITPRPHQAASLEAVKQGFLNGASRLLIDACVGSGKSLTIALIGIWARELGLRCLTVTHVRELAEQVEAAGIAVGLRVGVNAASLNRRDWRGQFIVAAIQSVFRNARAFGPIDILIIDEVHMVPHGDMGMYRQLIRDLGVQRIIGLTGTPFRLNGGSLIEGEGALFDRIVYTYSIIDGIRDGYLVPAFSATVDDTMDVSTLKVSQGEFTGSSQDAQMIALMDNHLAQMRVLGASRKRWLIFEASTKAAKAMTKRMNEWGIATGLVLGTTPQAERSATIAAYRSGRLRALVNVAALCVGFDVPDVDMLVMRRATQSLGLYVQMIGRGLRTVGGNIDASIRAGKADCLVLDYASNISTHGALDFLRPKDTVARFASCDACSARVPAAAMRCWSCNEPMTKNCPACLQPIQKGLLDCPLCGHDMRKGGDPTEAKPAKLLERPSGAALIASYKAGTARQGGWEPIRKAWERQEGDIVVQTADAEHILTGALAAHAKTARWIRATGDALLVPNGLSRNSVLQVTATAAGEVVQLPVPMPSSVG